MIVIIITRLQTSSRTCSQDAAQTAVACLGEGVCPRGISPKTAITTDRHLTVHLYLITPQIHLPATAPTPTSPFTCRDVIVIMTSFSL